eukprot:TRINITY_DN7313_c0_g1_i1.p1 TRINITY_DN7313_c0_g1~~TRINITY_DN7313_c0_g1_i1.p1  ORF type:complete len:905 (+),score=269.92 TRINITY_DN7313_c0_g1_i1:36-2717(+)
MSGLRLLVCLVLLNLCSALEWKAIPFLVPSPNGLQIDARARQAFEEMHEGVEVVSVWDDDNVHAHVTNLLWTQYQNEAKLEEKPEPFEHKVAPVWMLYAGINEKTGKHRVILSANMLSCKVATNSTRYAFTMTGTVSQAMVLDYTTRKDEVKCPALLKALAAEADHTMRVVHNPLCTGDCLHDQTLSLPDLSVVTHDFRPEIEMVIGETMKHSNGTTAYKSVDVVLVPAYAWTVKAQVVLDNSADKDKKRLQDAFSRIDAVVAQAAAPWVATGTRFLLWVEHVLDARGAITSLPIKYTSTYVSKMVHVGTKTALERYRREMKGVAEYGYVLRSDASTVIAIAPGHASLRKAGDEEDPSKALINRDVTMERAELRPPSEEALAMLHEAEKARAAGFIANFLYDITDAAEPTAEVMKKINAEYKKIITKNKENIKLYISGYVGDIYDAQVTALTAKRKDFPLPKTVIDKNIESLMANAKRDFEIILGQLNATEEAEEGRKTLVQKLDSLFNSHHKINRDEITRKLKQHADKALKFAEGKTLDLPLGKSALKHAVDAIDKEALDVWNGLIADMFTHNSKSEVWPERAAVTDEMKKKLLESLFSMRKDYEAANRIEVQKKCKVNREKLSAKYMSEVVQGNKISYPGSEDTVFEAAVSLAISTLIEFNNTLAEFQDTTVFEQELQEMEARLQELICGDAFGKGRSVMGTNVELLSGVSWVSDAMQAAQAEIRRRESDEDAGTIFQDELSKKGGSSYAELSPATKQKLSNHWCITELGKDCPGNCDPWSAHAFVHILDVVALCEPTWSWCNFNIGKDIEKGEKFGDTPFHRCSVPVSKPCPSYWERRGTPFMKPLFRIVWVSTLLIAIAVTFVRTKTPKKTADAVIPPRSTPKKKGAKK